MRVFAVSLAAVLALSTVSVQAETYTIDPAHTQFGFSIRHLGVSTVKGRFNEFEGTITYAGDPKTLAADVTIRAESIDTGNDKRDSHLRNEDYFEVETYPTLTFSGDEVVQRDGRHYLVGMLTIKDVTREVELEVEVSGPVDSPWQDDVSILGLAATGEIDRQDFNVAHDGASDNLIGDTVTFDISLEAKSQAAE